MSKLSNETLLLKKLIADSKEENFSITFFNLSKTLIDKLISLNILTIGNLKLLYLHTPLDKKFTKVEYDEIIFLLRNENLINF